jgi:hypothetical protein
MAQERQTRLRRLLAYVDALVQAMEACKEGDPTSAWRYASYKQHARRYNVLLRAASRVLRLDPSLAPYDLRHIPDAGSTLPAQQRELFESVYRRLVLLHARLKEALVNRTGGLVDLRDFLQRHLRKAIFHTPQREVEVQDALEQLLIGRGLKKGRDYGREVGRVKMSIKEVIPDFIFPDLDLALEVKLAKDRAKSRAIVDEINADILAYGRRYAHQLFVVYDLGTIRDEVEFKRGLETRGRVAVVVVKH